MAAEFHPEPTPLGKEVLLAARHGDLKVQQKGATRLAECELARSENRKHCGENAANQFAYNLLQALKALDLRLLHANHGWSFVQTRFGNLRAFSVLVQPVVPPADWKLKTGEPVHKVSF